MRTEKNINRIRFLYLTLKGMGIIFFVPYIFIFLILPAATYMENLSGNDFDNLYYYSFVLIQILCPFFSIWWSLLGFREFIDGSGKEILLVYKKSIILELFLTYLFYFLHMTAVFAVYVLVFNFNYFPYLIICTAESFAFFAVPLSLAFWLRNMSIPFIIAIIYEIFCIGSNTAGLGFINILAADLPKSIIEMYVFYISVIIISALLLILSHNKKYRKM